MKWYKFFRDGAIVLCLVGLAAGVYKSGALGGLLVAEGAFAALTYSEATREIKRLKRREKRRRTAC